MSRQFTPEEVATHNKEGNAYIIVENNVYDISKFATLHPGGKGVILGVAGQNATEQFWQFHNKQILNKYKRLIIGTITKSGPTQSRAESSSSSADDLPITQRQYSQDGDSALMYGELVPYGDPTSLQGWHSPYFNASHHRVRKIMRAWVEEHVSPFVTQW